MLRRLLAVLGLGAAIAGPVGAQTTGIPVFMAPYRGFVSSEIGGSFAQPGSGVAFEGFYRLGQKRYDLGFEAGFRTVHGDTRLLLGVDVRTRILDQGDDFPLDGALTVGVGGDFGRGASVAYIPLGVSLGRKIAMEGGSATIIPYLHPVIAPSLGSSNSVLFALGLGVDIKFSPRYELRVSGGLGDFQGVGISFAVLR